MAEGLLGSGGTLGIDSEGKRVQKNYKTKLVFNGPQRA